MNRAERPAPHTETGQFQQRSQGSESGTHGSAAAEWFRLTGTNPPPSRGKTECPKCGHRTATVDVRDGWAKCHHSSCEMSAKFVDGRWVVSGEQAGDMADRWIAEVTAVFATSTDKAAGAGLRVALAVTPLIAIFGPDSIRPGSDWVSEHLGSGPQVVANGIDWLKANALLVETVPPTPTQAAVYSATPINATQREGRSALRENYVQWSAELPLTMRRIAPTLLRRDGVGVAAMQGWALLVLHGERSGSDMARVSDLPPRTAQRRLSAAVTAGLAVAAPKGAATLYRLATADTISAAAVEASKRVAPGVDRNAMNVAARRDRTASHRAVRRLERVASRVDEYRPHDDDLIEHLSPGERERVAVIAACVRPRNHPLRRLLGTPQRQVVERVAVDVVAGVLLAHHNYRPMDRRDVALVNVLPDREVERLIDLWGQRRKVVRDATIVRALFRRRPRRPLLGEVAA